MATKELTLGRLIPDPEVWRRYGVTPTTGYRWDQDPDLNFPPAVVIRGRKYRDAEQLAAWEAAQTQKGNKGRTPPGRKPRKTEAA